MGDDEEKVLLKGVDVERDSNNYIRLAPILRHLEAMGYSVKDTMVSFKSQSENAFIHIGKEPLSEEFSIHPNELEPNYRLTIRCR